jgi:hypothetical protein
LKDLQRDIGLLGVQLETNCAGLVSSENQIGLWK